MIIYVLPSIISFLGPHNIVSYSTCSLANHQPVTFSWTHASYSIHRIYCFTFYSFPTSRVPKRKSRILSALIRLANHILIAGPIVKPQARIQFSPSPSRCPTWPPCQAHWGGETPPWHHPRRRRCTRAQLGCRLGPKEAFLAWESIGFARQFFFKWWNFISTRWCPPVISWFINPINYSYICHKP